MKIVFLSAAMVLSFAFLSGCGINNSPNSDNNNNGGSGTLSTGVYQGAVGTGSGSNGAVILITPDSQFWAVYSETTTALTPLHGLVSGQVAQSGLNYTGSAAVFPAPGTSSSTGTITINSASSNSVGGTITEGSTSDSFSGNTLSGFSFTSGAQISALSGNAWAATFLDNDTATLVVDSSGTISGMSAAGCAISGTVKPDASGTNYFDLTLTFGAAPCTVTSSTLTGVAVVAGSDSSGTFFGAATTSDKTMGSAFVATAVAAGTTSK